MNILLLCAYFFSLLTLSKKRNLILASIIIFAYILGGKLLSLEGSKGSIEPELISPTSLSLSGDDVLAKLADPVSTKNSIEICAKTNDCLNVEGPNDELVLDRNINFLFFKQPNVELKKWMKGNKLLIDYAEVFRGRYLHHYSVILFPYRQIVEGNYGYSLTSQYGLISLLPLFLFQDVPFVYYGSFGILCLLLAGVYLLWRNRMIFPENVYISVILILLALSTNIDAIRISPGFSYIRYLPFLAIIYFTSIQLQKKISIKYILLIGVLALLNSVQFNILLFLILLFSTLSIAYVNGAYKNNALISGLMVIASVIGLQITLYYLQKNSFSPDLFSSVGEGGKNRLYGTLILLFPIFIKLVASIKNYSIDFDAIKFSNEEIIAFICYGFSATYTISSAFSPQHYAGFILMSSYSIYVLFNKIIRTQLVALSVIASFIGIPYYFSYVSTGQKFTISESSFFKYDNKIGKHIYFNSPMNINNIANDFEQITKNYDDKNGIYLLSKDKIFIETMLNKNLNPKIYDVFPNLYNISPGSILEKLKIDNASYIVLDNSELRDASRRLVETFSATLSETELSYHRDILGNLDQLSIHLKQNLIECNDRYCIYRVGL